MITGFISNFLVSLSGLLSCLFFFKYRYSLRFYLFVYTLWWFYWHICVTLKSVFIYSSNHPNIRSFNMYWVLLNFTKWTGLWVLRMKETESLLWKEVLDISIWLDWHPFKLNIPKIKFLIIPNWISSQHFLVLFMVISCFHLLG